MSERIQPPISPDMPTAFRLMSSDDLARLLGYNKFAIDINGYKARHPKTVDFIRRSLTPELRESL